MLNTLLALVLPFFMMLFFTRVSYSKVGALLVTLMIIIFAFNGLQQSYLTIAAGFISVVAGFVASFKMEKKNKGV